MIKIALYGFLRIIFYVLGVKALWWGILLLVLAMVSCLVGVIYALMEHDLKRLLAYHSVENIGIILLGIALTMIYSQLKLFPLASLAMVAALYHLVNHASFKSLLFLCAGSVQKGAGLLDLEKLGGLIKKMPWTAVFFLIGAMGISALPPLNGFVSEWLTLIAFFLGTFRTAPQIIFLLVIGAAALALTSGLAAACFVKAFGIAFLALPRSEQAKTAHEASGTMLLGMGVLAAAVVGLGLAAPLVVKLLTTIPNTLFGPFPQLNGSFILYPTINLALSVSPLIITLLLGLGLIVAAIFYYLPADHQPQNSATWDCGYYQINGRNEYTATAFSKPFRISFSFFLLPFRKSQQVKDSFYHVKSFVYETYTTKIFQKYLYDSCLALTLRVAKAFRHLQAGSIHLYLAYISGTLLLLILLLGWL